jgi:hypothetical protein
MAVHNQLDWMFTIKRNRCSRSTGTRNQPRHNKAHGRPARSLFALGLDALRKLCAPRTFVQSLQLMLGLLIGRSVESLI